MKIITVGKYSVGEYHYMDGKIFSKSVNIEVPWTPARDYLYSYAWVFFLYFHICAKGLVKIQASKNYEIYDL